ncbi:MAG: V-type ATPase 116kDa subunit family protein [Candidatus Geothermarchaeales archaeon]
MLTQKEMVKVRIYVYHRFFDAVVHELGTLAVLHQIDAKSEFAESGGHVAPIELGERYHTLRSLLGQTESLMETLQLSPSQSRPERGTLDEESISELTSEIGAQLEGGLPAHEVASIFGERLRSAEIALKAEVARQEFQARCGQTGKTKITTGWIPREDLSSTMNRLLEVSQRKLEYTVVESVSHGSGPPSQISFPTRNSVLQSFSRLTTSFSAPRYREIDPTLLQLVTYPLFFALMFGDVGHGLLLLLVGFGAEYLRRTGYRSGSLGNMVLDNAGFIVLLGVASTIVGAVSYGIVFGSANWGHTLRELIGLGFLNSKEVWEIPFLFGVGIPVVFEPFKNPISLFKLSLVIGTFHITLGIAISVIDHIREGKRIDAFVGPGTWLIFYLSAVYLLFLLLSKGVKFAFSTDAMYIVLPPILLMLISRGVVHRGMGINESLESLLQSLSHTISYSRILAMAMIHEVLSMIFLGDLFGVPWPYNLLTVGVGAVVILLLEGMLSMIQTIRLHWVEWFTKFYVGNGVKYSPFSL